MSSHAPIVVAPPNHVVLKVEYAEPAVRGNTATNLSKPVKLESDQVLLLDCLHGLYPPIV